MRPPNTKRRDIVLGPLPVASINRTLGLELDAGFLVVKKAAQVHAERRHPEEYPVILPSLREVLASALYVGDDLRNGGKIELIGRIAALGQFILIAVIVEPDVDGNYRVASFYPISEAKIQNRREKGFLTVLR